MLQEIRDSFLHLCVELRELVLALGSDIILVCQDILSLNSLFLLDDFVHVLHHKLVPLFFGEDLGFHGFA